MHRPVTPRRAALAAAVALLTPAAPAAAAPWETRLVTRAADGSVPTDAASEMRSDESPAISADGGWVSFASDATGLIPGLVGTYQYRRPFDGGPTELVSRADGFDGAPIGLAVSDSYGISHDGNRVAFAVRVGPAGPLSPDLRLLVRDVAAGRTLEPARADGFDGAPVDAYGGVLSANGRYVAFASAADGVVPGVPSGLGTQVYLRDLEAGRTVLVSRGPGREGPLAVNENQGAHAWAISPGGRFVVFSNDSSWEPGGPGGQLWLRDVRYGRTLLVSRADGPDGAPAASVSGNASVTADGCRVSFSARDDQLVSGLRLALEHVFQRNLCTDRTVLVDRADGPAGEVAYSRHATFYNDFSHASSQSADGRYVAFDSYAANLLPGRELDDRLTRSWLRDLDEGRTLLLSRADGIDGDPGVGGGSAISAAPQLSANAGRVAFASSATGLVPDVIPNGHWAIYQRELAAQPAGTPVDASLDDPGTGPPNEPLPEPEPPAEPRPEGPQPLVTVPPVTTTPPSPAPPAGPTFVVPPQLKLTRVAISGRTLRLRLSAPARVTATVERKIVTRKRSRTIVSWRRAATRTLRARRAGTVSARLPALRAGRYRVAVRAVALDGGTRASATRGFRVAMARRAIVARHN